MVLRSRAWLTAMLPTRPLVRLRKVPVSPPADLVSGLTVLTSVSP